MLSEQNTLIKITREALMKNKTGKGKGVKILANLMFKIHSNITQKYFVEG